MVEVTTSDHLATTRKALRRANTASDAGPHGVTLQGTFAPRTVTLAIGIPGTTLSASAVLPHLRPEGARSFLKFCKRGV